MQNKIRDLFTNRKWQGEAPASEEALNQLLGQSRLPLPADYLDLLRYSNGGQGFLRVQPYLFRLWPAEQVMENNLDYQMPDYVPGFFGFGDDGGEHFFAFDAGWMIHCIPFVPMEMTARVFVAEDILSLVNSIERVSS